MGRLSRLMLFAVPVCLGLASNASAATYTVTDSADAALSSPASTSCASTDGGKCTLRAAVQAADNAGGSNTISIPAGTYKLVVAPTGTTPASDPNDPAHGDLDVLNNATVTITGAGSAKTIINANELDRAFAVQMGGALALSGLTIENGSPATQSSGGGDGGGIYSNGALALTGDVAMRLNAADGEDGGAIYVDSGSTAFSVASSTFSDNTSEEGGAIDVDASTVPVNISSSTFSRNDTTDDEGGAIYDDNSGAVTISKSAFSDNSADHGDEDGGAVYEDSDSPFTVTGSSFDDNQGESGAAINDNESSAETITGSSFDDNEGENGALNIDNHNTTLNLLVGDEFTGNRVSSDGGAINWDDGSLTIISSSLVDNRADGAGGGLYVDNSQPLVMTDTTISGNYSRFGGGVNFDETAAISLTNDTIAFNAAPSTEGGGVYHASETVTGGTGVVNTLIGDNTGGDCGYGAVDSHFKAGDDAGNNLDSDGTCFGGLGVTTDKTSVDPLLGEPAANGGPVETDALEAGSQAIDAANAGRCPTTDARGVARPQGAGCDIGAFEASKPTVTIVAPGNGARFALGAVVKASYRCSEAGLPGLIASCRGPVASGAAIDTSKSGRHAFVVTVVDDQGLTATATVSYTVKASPPNTKITAHNISGHSISVKFKGSGGSGRLSFRCKLDTGKFKKCGSPKKYTGLSKGHHAVSVEAVDATGRPDPTPAKLTFKIS
jgi:hypothetical protein